MRDYNQEIIDNNARKYAYGFDLDVMHPYMMKSFEPFFAEGNILELGCYKGAFTRRLAERFENITCIEASDEAIEEAKIAVGKNVNFICSLFEDAVVDQKFDNIVLTHVLEHIDDRIGLLHKINEEWLSDKGVFLVVCPNAHAPSRQIAVKMGLISHCEEVTEGERQHGHRVTYTLDTLRKDLLQSGMEIIHESGIFFKALANFQWDRLLQTDIITKEYLEGCYELGKEYPDLCSSIFFVCRKGSGR